MGEWRYSSTIHDLGTSCTRWPASHPSRCTPWERNFCTDWVGGWLGPRAGLDAVEKRKTSPLSGIEPRSSSLYPVAIPTLYFPVYNQVSTTQWRWWGNGGIAPGILHGGYFTVEETSPGTHCIGGWVGPRRSLDGMENTICRESKPDSSVIQLGTFVLLWLYPEMMQKWSLCWWINDLTFPESVIRTRCEVVFL
jgi:hypothetical protein